MITAHSGSDGYPDNSREFIEAIIKSKVDAFEIDTQIASNGQIYLSHDPVEDWESLLTLEDCFELLKKNEDIIINIDCKNKEIGPKALVIAEQMGLKNQVVLSGALELESFKQKDYLHLFYNLENYQENQVVNLVNLELVFEEIYQQGIEVIQLYHGLVTQEIVDSLSQVGLKLSVWTVNDFHRIDELLELGCYNVTSRTALAYLKQK